MPWEALAYGLLAYLLGSIPFGYLLYRYREGRDIRDTGSGNIGATNVFRAAGMAPAITTLLLDASKGYLAVYLTAHATADSQSARGAAALLVILGHVFPLFLKFRGGKGVATGFGAFLAIAPFSALICAGIFALVVLTWRYVSLASITAAAAFPLVMAAREDASPLLLAAAVLGAALIVMCHRSNIQRLWTGTEVQIPSRKRTPAG
ncbi:MAG TPA: glycerol-3-phosphate 1-O-acyltransferase PlsY [Terriglobia bacterium]|jgi:glycerol-3-phosphate acyltransferase PlsY